MTKEKKQVVSEVNEVISSIRSKIHQEGNITIDDINNLLTTLKIITKHTTK